ncbi:uncharacterized protein TNCV_1922921 [Trichonephila clavipes]|nr:uncharacterized protein TNCV_1922921 [Trichonephila clavipes]
MEQKYDEYGRAFISKYVSEENGWTLTPDAWFDMVINPFIRNFPILKVHTPNMSGHIWTTRLDDERLVHPEHFPTVAYLEMKRVRNPRSEGKRIFRNLMDLPPLDNIEVVSNNAQVNYMDILQGDDFSEVANMQMSFEASDNTTSDEVDDSSNNANNEVLDSRSSNNVDNMTSNNIEEDILHAHASDNMDDSSSDGVLDTSTNIKTSSDILHADASDNMELDNTQSSSDTMISVTMASDNMAQIEDETNLYKGKLIWVGRNMQTS